jgi:Helix-turn-helix domain
MRQQREDLSQNPTFTELPEVLTVRDLEALLKIDIKTIYGYVQRGLIPYVRIQSNLRFLKSQIVVWIENQNHTPTTSSSFKIKRAG